MATEAMRVEEVLVAEEAGEEETVVAARGVAKGVGRLVEVLAVAMVVVKVRACVESVAVVARALDSGGGANGSTNRESWTWNSW